MKAETIFTDMSDLRAYVEGLTVDTTYEQLIPSIKTVTADIMAIITAKVYLEIRNDEREENTGLEHLKTAVAAGAAYRYAIFASVKKNGSDASLYKYQFEEMKGHYIEAQWKAMDALLDWLDENSAEWRSTDTYATRQSLPIKNAREFNAIYGIDNSSFFFQKVLHFIKSTWDFKVQRLIPSGSSEKALDIAKHILVYRTLAQAVMQFDVAELPRSIRWDYSHEYAKDSSMQSREKLYNQLMGQVETWEEALKTMESAKNATVIRDDHNDESNKYYSML